MYAPFRHYYTITCTYKLNIVTQTKLFFRTLYGMAKELSMPAKYKSHNYTICA